jgi:hypothetical protein
LACSIVWILPNATSALLGSGVGRFDQIVTPTMPAMQNVRSPASARRRLRHAGASREEAGAGGEALPLASVAGVIAASCSEWPQRGQVLNALRASNPHSSHTIDVIAARSPIRFYAS